MRQGKPPVLLMCSFFFLWGYLLSFYACTFFSISLFVGYTFKIGNQSMNRSSAWSAPSRSSSSSTVEGTGRSTKPSLAPKLRPQGVNSSSSVSEGGSGGGWIGARVTLRTTTAAPIRVGRSRLVSPSKAPPAVPFVTLGSGSKMSIVGGGDAEKNSSSGVGGVSGGLDFKSIRSRFEHGSSKTQAGGPSPRFKGLGRSSN